MSRIEQIQTILGTVPDGIWGPKTQAALDALLSAIRNPQSAILQGDGTWPFTARVDGADIVCEDIVITCFGGAFDPQDSGDTASGVSTRDNPLIKGVSIAMDGRQFAHLSPAEHRALDGSPFPKMPWNTLVEVTIGGVKFTPVSGIIDLGPGKQASRPGEPHALDLTPAAAQFFRPNIPLHRLATSFEARGSFRILGGAQYLRARFPVGFLCMEKPYNSARHRRREEQIGNTT